MDSMTGSYLRRFINGGDSRPDSQRHSGVLLVDAVHEAGPLIPRPTPVIEKAIDDAGILKHDIVDVSVRLTIQGHRAENSKAQKG